MASSQPQGNAHTLKIRVIETLPEPFDWCYIPAGEVTIVYGDWNRYSTRNLEKTPHYAVIKREPYPVEAFYMAKYPVTYAQFEPFVVEGGYDVRAFWTEQGWDWKQAQGHIAPRYWNNPKWHIPDHPVVCIEQYEAMAYAQWLSHRTGLPISLPTEQQWQRATGGDDGRLYPWGDLFDPSRANTREGGIGGTTPVTHYSTGASAYGVMDMGGNVWEWTVSLWQPGSSSDMVIRGGSFNHESNTVTVKHRRNSQPTTWDYTIGMRLICGAAV